MSVVTAQIVRRFVGASRLDETGNGLLQSIGIGELDTSTALRQMVSTDVYYDLLEQAAGDDDHELGLRYGESITPEDFGAMGLAMKTASTLGECLQRLVRYILVLSDSLAYELRHRDQGWTLSMRGRQEERRGARLANEGALAAIVSLLRQVSGRRPSPIAVAFSHPKPTAQTDHEAFFGCPVRFDAKDNALVFDDTTLEIPTRLADEGLSTYLLSQLDELREEQVDRSLEAQVRRAIADSLCDGAPSRVEIAKRLGMSERTLHRRLSESGLSFRTVADGARREAAEALLKRDEHSIAEVAFLTGFSEQSAFQRAFKRWSGKTPAQFRSANAR